MRKNKMSEHENTSENYISEMEGTSQTKQSTFRKYLPTLLVFVVLGIMMIFAKKFGAKAPVVNVSGVEVKVGSTKASAFTDACFELEGDADELSNNQYLINVDVKKDGKTYAVLTVYNSGFDMANLEECKIGEISVNNGFCEDIDSFTVDGTKIFEMSPDEICESMNYEKTSETLLSYEKGSFLSIIELEDGKPEEYKVSFDFK